MFYLGPALEQGAWIKPMADFIEERNIDGAEKSNICVTRNFSEFHVRISTLHSSKLRKP
ncbi:MAG: hypothetical protein R6U41_03680 [Desulfosalsimonas sp.]|uniref:hypothetical protein n=1 Tax=Desulfosalsimonas sp. TaxID=3073848 RepID=UPI003970A0F5